jgi:hypothetical protein
MKQRDTENTEANGAAEEGLIRWTPEEHAIFKREFEAQAEDVPFQERARLAQVLIHKVRRKKFGGPSCLPWAAKAYREGRKTSEPRKTGDRRPETGDRRARKAKKISAIAQNHGPSGAPASPQDRGGQLEPHHHATRGAGAPRRATRAPAPFEQYTLTECLAALEAIGKRITQVADQLREATRL